MPPGHSSRKEPGGSISQYQASSTESAAQTTPGRRPPTKVESMIAGKKVRKGKPRSAGPSAKRTAIPAIARTMASTNAGT